MQKMMMMALCSAFLIGAVALGNAQTKTKTYKYKCPKCSRVVEYSSPQAGPKCPSGDGYTMVPTT